MTLEEAKQLAEQDGTKAPKHPARVWTGRGGEVNSDEQYIEFLKTLAKDLIENAYDTVWVSAYETAVDRIQSEIERLCENR